MAIDLKRRSESELNALYTSAAYRFAQAATWREYMALADEFRDLDTYKDSARLYAQCIKAASAPAYREITDKIAASAATMTAAEYREAARIMQIIQDFGDAREMMRVYTLKANALDYAEAVLLVSNADATTEELGRGVELLRGIKTYRNAREMLERFEKYYFERMYAEGLTLMQGGHVYSEFDEAADIFEKIREYSDAAEQAAACRKRANKLRPKARKEKAPKTSKTAKATPDEVTHTGDRPVVEADTTVRKRRRRIDDETRNTVAEVWKTMDKRHLASFIIWVVLLVADVYASMVLPGLEHEFCQKYANEIRGVTTMVAIFTIAMAVRAFFRMLTAGMRRKLREATVRALKKLAAPFVNAFTKLLMSIGIDLSRRGRLSGRDEKSIIRPEEVKGKKKKKRLKNDLKWQEQPDNAARVRFIFIDYMIRRIKSGYLMKRTMTPAEIGQEVAIEEDEKLLFAAYDKARYGGAGAVEELSDAVVGELRMLNQRKSL